MFGTSRHSALDEDLQTGIPGGEYKVAFEIDEIDTAERIGWRADPGAGAIDSWF
jgi:hypothetical protein